MQGVRSAKLSSSWLLVMTSALRRQSLASSFPMRFEFVFLSISNNDGICFLKWGLKKNPVFRATRPYLSEPADPRLFLTKMPFFRWGLYNWGFNSKKKRSRPYLKFLRLLPKTQDFFFWPGFQLVNVIICVWTQLVCLQCVDSEGLHACLNQTNTNIDIYNRISSLDLQPFLWDG